MSLAPEEKLARLERALAYGGHTHTVADVVAQVKEGRAQFWEHGDGSIVTELVVYPRFSTVRYWLISGTLGDCLALDAPISEWARGEGCTIAEASGRRGWGRAGAPFGWKPRGYLFYKGLAP